MRQVEGRIALNGSFHKVVMRHWIDRNIGDRGHGSSHNVSPSERPHKPLIIDRTVGTAIETRDAQRPSLLGVSIAESECHSGAGEVDRRGGVS
jgi:hypothetical protein